MNDEPPSPEGFSDQWQHLFRSALRHEGVPDTAEASLSFISAEEMTALNIEHMGGSGPTDVLSFPIDEWTPAMAECTDEAGPPIVVGDVVICIDVARNAVTTARSLDDEIALLVVHGVLHLLGHDHYEADERAVMQSREQVLLHALYAQAH